MKGEGIRSRKEPTPVAPQSASAPQHEADDVFHKWNSLRNTIKQIPKIESPDPQKAKNMVWGHVRCSVVQSDILHVHGDIVLVRQRVSHTLHSRVPSEHTLRHLVKCRLRKCDRVPENNVISDDNPRCHASDVPARSRFRHAQKHPTWSHAPEPRPWNPPTDGPPQLRPC